MDKEKEALTENDSVVINGDLNEKAPVLSAKKVQSTNSKQETLDIEEDNSKQSWLSRYSLQLFVANFSLLQLFQMTAVVYWIGVVRTVEKRFGLSSTQTNFIMSVNDIVHICIVIFVGYFGRKGHKPKIIAATAQCLVIGSLLMATPYFLYGEEAPTIILSNTTMSSYTSAVSYCDPTVNVTEQCGKDDDNSYINDKAWYIFMVASVFNGLGGVAMQVLGMAYVDENADKTKSSLYLGIITSTFALGPISGIFLAAFATKLPENLQPTEKSPSDPTWIGAWWLGYVFCAILIFLASLPVFFYPKHTNTSSNNQTCKTGDKQESLLVQAKNFPLAFMKLLTNKAYVILLITGISGVYVIMGVFVNTPRYLEIHFLQPAFIANIGAALPGIAGVFGGFIGGALMTKLKFTPVASAKMIVFSLTVTTVGLFFLMFISCPEVNLAGEWDADHQSISLDTSCNSNCSCSASKHTYHPVCGTDGATYFSPCHAGCTMSEEQNGTVIYNGCECLGLHTATDGLCEEPCNTKFYVFAGGMLLLSLLSSLGRVPGTVVQFRIVGEDEGSFALGVTSFAINLLGFIPAPILFGQIIDSTCILWQELCGETGACLFYDTKAFRLLTYGVSTAIEFVSCIFAVILVIVMSRMDFSKPEPEEKTISNGNIQDSKQQLIVVEKVTGF